MSGMSIFGRRPARKYPPARGGSPRRAAGTAGALPSLRKALGYAAGAIVLLLGAPAAFAQSVTLAASNVEHDTATLTLTNHTGDWYYKYTVPSSPADTCSTVVSSGTYTASLSSLTPATSYTYKAYSNSSCSTEITSDATDAEFLTKPAKVTGVTAAAGASASAGALDVGWTAVTGAASYKVQWKTSAQQWDATNRQSTSTTTSKTISGLTGGTQYMVRVAASNTSGDGPWSDTATGTASTEGATPSTTSLAVPEGGSASYTVVLDTTPSHAVTIAVANRGQSGDDADLTLSPTSLTFSTTNWNAPQAVTVTAAQDSDTADGSATLTHTATSSDSGYNGVTIANVTATEDDDDAPGALVSKTAVSVPEGGSATWTVRLASLPSATVFIDLAKQSGGDADLTVSPAQLTFTTKGWDLPQTVTVSAAEDTDAARGAATFTHTATSTDASYGASLAIASVTATEDDDELGVTVSKKAVSVPEGGSATWTVVLDGPPTANVTIAVAKQSGGDADLTVSPASLTFTSTNWSSVQTVTVSAAEDDTDDTDGSATITHTATSTDADYGGIAIASVTATEDDNDTLAGVTVSKTSLTVAEGGSATYTVVLDTAPTQNVTIAVANRGQSADDVDLTVSPSSLTFTTTNFASVQTVTLTAVEDADGIDESVTVSNAASGGGYGNVAAATLTATVDDDDQGVTLSVSSLTVPEGGTETYTVKLAAQPAGTVTVTIAKASGGDTDLTVNRSTLEFTTGNWSGTQTVTVTAAEESGDDSAHGTATFTHTASGGGYDASADLTATEADNDRVVGIPATLRVPEGGTATYTVKLAVQPSANVTLTLAVGGDSDLTVDTDTGANAPGDQNTLTFSNSNWDTEQTVTVAAAQDGDSANGAATISHTAASSDAGYDGIPIPSVRATEADDDTAPPGPVPGLRLSSSNVTVPEGKTATYTVALATRPDTVVTVTLTRDPGGDPDLGVDTDPGTPGAQSTLVFTPARWNIAQTVTVAAAPDEDRLDGTATFTHTATGGGYGGVSATLTAVEADDNRRIVLWASSLTVPEGGAATYTVALAAQPIGDVRVTLVRSPGGDADLAVDTDPDAPGFQSTLVFTPAHWSDARTVAVAAAVDADGFDGAATFTHTASGGGYGGVSATLAAAEADDDRRLVLSVSRLTVPEGMTATYTVALASEPVERRGEARRLRAGVGRHRGGARRGPRILAGRRPRVSPP